jgi:hypothetical protein
MYPINYLPPKAPMIRNRTGFFDDVTLNEIKTAADSFIICLEAYSHAF